MREYMKLILAIIFIVYNLFAQPLSQLRLEGKSEVITSELISKDNKDSNGEICAGLVILTDLTGLNYQSSLGIVKNNQSIGKDFLFLSPSERMVEVFCSGYQPLKIILNEVGIKLKSGEVWQIKITGDKKADLISVQINVTPSDADIFIDGNSQSKARTFRLTKGEHQIVISKDGFVEQVKTLYVSEENFVFNYNLLPVLPVLVKFGTVPQDALIYIDNIEKGKTDKDINLKPGNYRVKIFKSGYQEVDQTITVDQNRENIFSYNLVKSIAELVLEITPKEAEVKIDKENNGTKRSFELAPGIYQLEIIKDGYRSLSETVELKLGDRISKNYNLVPLKGNLFLTVFPVDAEVKLLRKDKIERQWTGSKNIVELLVGEYTLEVDKQGYEKRSASIIIEENKNTELDIELKISSKSGTELTSKDSCPKTVLYAGKTYHTVQIGTQCWLKENLDAGTMIQGEQEQTDNGVIEKYCYDNDPNNCVTYGGLYQWAEAVQYKNGATNTRYPTQPFSGNIQGICPIGWHIPTKDEFNNLMASVQNNGNKLKEIGQGYQIGAGINTSGFSALLAGFRTINPSSEFSKINGNSTFWSSTYSHNNVAYYFENLWYNEWCYISNIGYVKGYGMSIRCIKN
jgi:uncharacterized protein (TIGR02145 family)